jgi:glutamate-1-semialdehyde 2,1-aminomutase
MAPGIAIADRDFTSGFRCNDRASVEELLQHPGQIGALFLEPATATSEPTPGFLEACGPG